MYWAADCETFDQISTQMPPAGAELWLKKMILLRGTLIEESGASLKLVPCCLLGALKLRALNVLFMDHRYSYVMLG